MNHSHNWNLPNFITSCGVLGWSSAIRSTVLNKVSIRNRYALSSSVRRSDTITIRSARSAKSSNTLTQGKIPHLLPRGNFASKICLLFSSFRECYCPLSISNTYSNLQWIYQIIVLCEVELFLKFHLNMTVCLQILQQISNADSQILTSTGHYYRYTKYSTLNI